MAYLDLTHLSPDEARAEYRRLSEQSQSQSKSQSKRPSKYGARHIQAACSEVRRFGCHDPEHPAGEELAVSMAPSTEPPVMTDQRLNLVYRYVSEKQFLAQVIQCAQLYRWLTYHTWNSQKSVAGFPDLVLVRTPRIIFAELKSVKGRVSPDQRRWLEVLQTCHGVETYMWRPSDWPLIERVLR